MSTISTSLGHLSRTSVLALQGPYYRLPKGQTAKYLPLSSVNGKQPSAADSGIGFDYLYDGLNNFNSILNKRSKNYQVQRQTSRTEFNRAMSEAGKSGASLKNIDYQKAAKQTEAVTDKVQKAADSLGELVKDSGLERNARQTINGGLSTLQKNIEAVREGGNEAKEKAAEAAAEIKKTWEEAAGIDDETADVAAKTADIAGEEVSHYAQLGAGTASFMEQGAKSLVSYIDRFEQIGRFDADNKRMEAVLNTFTAEAERSQTLAGAADKLTNFADKYKMDDEPESTAVSVGVLSEYGGGIAKWGQEAKTHLTNSVAAVEDFLREGREASAETTAKARNAAETLAELAAGYADATRLNQDDRKWLEDSANDMKALTKQAARPFEYVRTLDNFAQDYGAAEKAAGEIAADTAKEIQSALDGYNNNVAHLQDRRGVSTRFDSNGRDDTLGFLRDLSRIGLNVGFTGEISVNTDKLAVALQNEPENTEKLLGVNGLGGKMSESVAASSYQTGHTAATINYLGDRASNLLSPRLTALAMMYGNGNGNTMMNMFMQ